MGNVNNGINVKFLSGFCSTYVKDLQDGFVPSYYLNDVSGRDSSRTENQV